MKTNRLTTPLRSLALVAVGLLSALLAGCGGGGSGAVAPASSASSGIQPLYFTASGNPASRTLTVPTAADCTRIQSHATAVSQLTISDSVMQFTNDTALAISPNTAYSVFVRDPVSFMYWVRQRGAVDAVTLQTAAHETIHQIKYSMRTCIPDGLERMFVEGTIYSTGLAHNTTQTPNLSVAAAGVPTALKSTTRYTAYISGAASGNDMRSLLDEFTAYLNASTVEVAFWNSSTYSAFRFWGDADTGGMVDFMLYTAAYLNVLRTSYPAEYAFVKGNATTVAYLQRLWTRAEAILDSAYPNSVLSGHGGITVSKDALNAVYKTTLLSELAGVGVTTRASTAWDATFLK